MSDSQKPYHLIVYGNPTYAHPKPHQLFIHSCFSIHHNTTDELSSPLFSSLHFPFFSPQCYQMYALSPPHHFPQGRHPSFACRAVATPNRRISDTPTIAPPGSKKNGSATLDPALRSTWPHRAWVAAGSATVLTALANSITAASESGSIVEPALAAVLGYVLADLGSGFYHFGIDNYGSPSTPVFGSQIEGFQGHHRRPSTITRRQPANNLHALARAVVFTVLPLELAVGGAPTTAAAHAFIGACAGCVMLSQQFHAWSHGTKGRVPHWVEVLQGAGVLISRDMHGAHHKAPYNNNYCIVSGMWNWLLDEYSVFEAVELVVFFKFGVRPRSWGELAEEWKEEEEDTEEDIGRL